MPLPNLKGFCPTPCQTPTQYFLKPDLQSLSGRWEQLHQGRHEPKQGALLRALIEYNDDYGGRVILDAERLTCQERCDDSAC